MGGQKNKKQQGDEKNKKIWEYQRAGGRWLNLSKFTRFLGGPDGPKICGRGTKIDFKDREWYNYIRSLSSV